MLRIDWREKENLINFLKLATIQQKNSENIDETKQTLENIQSKR